MSKGSDETPVVSQEEEVQEEEEPNTHSPILHVIEPPLSTSSPKQNSPSSKSTKREIDKGEKTAKQATSSKIHFPSEPAFYEGKQIISMYKR